MNAEMGHRSRASSTVNNGSTHFLPARIPLRFASSASLLGYVHYPGSKTT